MTDSSRASPRARPKHTNPKSSAAIVAVAALGAVVWGLALARALAEGDPVRFAFEPPSLLMIGIGVFVLGMLLGSLFAKSELAKTAPRLGPALVPLLLPLAYLFWPSVAPRVGWTLLGGSLVLSVLLALASSERARLPNSNLPLYWLFILILAMFVFAVYLVTLAPTVGQADSFEFQVVAPTLGVAHPTGYPVYVLSGKLFSLLPIGSVAWRVNLASAVFAVCAIVLVFLLALRLTENSWAALFSALILALSRVFWSQAVVAEVYTLHNLFVALLLLLLIEANRARQLANLQRNTEGRARTAEEAGGTEKRIVHITYAVFFMIGLSLANHLTTVLLLPAMTAGLVFIRPRLSPRQWLLAVGLFLLGLLFYLYIYVRWPMLNDGIWMSARDFWRYVSGQQFGGALKLDAWRTDLTRYEIVGRLVYEPFGWPGLVLGIVGFVWTIVKNRFAALLTALTFVAYVWYGLSYYVPDVSVFVLPTHLILAIWLGSGVVAVLTALRAIGGRTNTRPQSTAWIHALVITLLALLPLWLLWTNLPERDHSASQASYLWGDRVLELPLARDAAILADSVRIAPLYYLQRIEGKRPDLDILVLADESIYRHELDARLAAGQTVYLARFLPGLEGLYHLRSVGPLTEVGVSPIMETPELEHELVVRFVPPAAPSARWGDVELLGYSGPDAGPDGGTGLTLFWRSDQPVGEIYYVRLRLVDSDGKVWWQNEGRHPANNYYPTVAWRPGEVVLDYHEIPPLEEKSLALQVGLFLPFSDDGLLIDNDQMWATLSRFDWPILAAKKPPDHRLLARYATGAGSAISPKTAEDGVDKIGSELTLVGVDLPEVVGASAPLELKLHWVPYREGVGSHDAGGSLSSGRVSAGVQPILTWTGANGIGFEAPLVEAWGLVRLMIEAPPSPGDYVLRLGLTDEPGQKLTARCGWLGRGSIDCAVATVHVTESVTASRANFGGEILLVDAELRLPDSASGALSVVSPGQTVPVTLSWRALRLIDRDYTVSVQLVGPDGKLYGQADTWPVQGTFPTSQWSAGQTIIDSYEVTLAPDAPPGRYQLGVAVYLLETLARLPTVDETGEAKGNIAWLDELQVVPR